MFLEAHTCTETVSILEAIVFGAGEACVEIGMGSLLGAVAGFVCAVLLIRFIAMQVLRRAVPGLFHNRRRAVDVPAGTENTPLERLPYESPVRSTGAWGGKRR